MTDNDAVSASTRDRLVQLMFQVLWGGLSVEQFCGKYEHLHIHYLNNDTLADTEAQILREVFDVVIYYSPFEAERDRIPNYLGDAEVIDAVRRAIRKLNGGLVDVPRPVDFLARWGVDPVESDPARLCWTYDLGPLHPESSARVLLGLSGAEGWLRTKLETCEFSSSTALGGLQRLEFVEGGTPMPLLVGDFAGGGHLLRVEIEVYDELRIDWRDEILGPGDND